MIFNGNWCIKLAYPKFKAKNTHILPWCFFTPNAIIGGVKKNRQHFSKNISDNGLAVYYVSKGVF